MFPSPEAEQSNLHNTLATGTITKNTFLLARHARRKEIFPGPFIKSFLNGLESYPETKQQSQNCQAAVTLILFLNSAERGSVPLRERKPAHGKHYEKEDI